MSSLHHHTPTLTVHDPRGLAVRSVSYHRRAVLEQPQARIHRQVYDARGYLRQQWDPRLCALHAADPGVSPNSSHDYSLTGQVLKTVSVDSGTRCNLLGSAGQVLMHWDGKSACQRHEYDGLLRQVAVYEQAADEVIERCVERMTYGRMSPEHVARNACGRLVRHDDPAGTVFHDHYAVGGHVATQRRRLRLNGETTHWTESVTERDAQLQAQTFTTTWQYDALGQVLEQTDARGNRQLSRYGEDGALINSALVLASGARKTLLDQRTFNAQGQVIRERAGNGVVSMAQYALTDGRLQRLTAFREGQRNSPLQDLAYRYDRVGNLIEVRDAAQPTRWASNTRVEAVSTYGYDSLSQLIKATGREQARNQGGANLPAAVMFGSTQDDLWRQYTREYEYDAGGNLSLMRHLPSSGSGFTQRMRVGALSNHSLPGTEPSVPGLGSGFDRNGNLQVLTLGQALRWNLRNQLVGVTQVQRDSGEHDDERYVYDGTGQRVTKRRSQRHGTRAHTHEVVYLPGLELHRDETSGEWRNVLVAEAGRATVRALQWERNRPATQADESIRFSFCDHLGSSTLELDEQAALLTQESYYPFGATAWWAAKNAVEASYKTVRYSGRERDATGLYYYGQRYYAPWLLRWISADPAGAVDGLNLYAMVGNNPVNLVDIDGTQARTALQLVALVVIFTLVGWGVGDAVGAPEIGAGVGLAVVLALLGFSGYQYAQQVHLEQAHRTAQRRADRRESDRVAQSYARGLTADEVAGLSQFFFEQLSSTQLPEFAYSVSTSARGGIYAAFGPANEMRRAQSAHDNQPNPSRFLQRLGYASYTVREPPLRRGSGPQPLGTVPETEVQPLTRATTIARKGGSASVHLPAASVTGPSSSLTPAPLLEIDTHPITHELQGPGGHVLRRVLDELIHGLRNMASGHAYRSQAKTRSFDLPGYRGHTRRGGYRLLIQHLGGHQYRATGVRDFHRA